MAEEQKTSVPDQSPKETVKEAKVSPKAGDNDAAENKIWGVLAYIWILSVVVYITKKDSPFALFHAKQGLVIFVLSVINTVIDWIIPGFFWYAISMVINIALLVLAIIGIVYALGGEKKEIPVIGQLAKKLNF